MLISRNVGQGCRYGLGRHLQNDARGRRSVKGGDTRIQVEGYHSGQDGMLVTRGGMPLGKLRHP